MATRKARLSNRDSQGQFSRQIGWKVNAAGKRVQHKFRLGSDSMEAERRDGRLRELWEQVEQAGGEAALWNETTLDIARQLAKGESVIRLKLREGESDTDYARRIRSEQATFATFRILPADEMAFTRGSSKSPYHLSDCLAWPKTAHEEWLDGRDENEPMRTPILPELSAVAHRSAAEPEKVFGAVMQANDGKHLHEALWAYIEWIEQEYFDPHLDRITDNAHTKIRQVKKLMERHDDLPLLKLEFEEVETMFRYWRRRPPRRVRGDATPGPISRKSSQNYIGELKRFFKWLHRSRRFAWRKPQDFDDIDLDVPPDPIGAQKRLVQAEVFTLAELELLNRYATPLERVFLLLGLNCAFGMKEIATLTIGEVFLQQGHSREHCELLAFDSTNQHSFIKRVRRKNSVYGEFILFPQTVEAMRWALARRLRQPNPAPDQPLLLNDRCEAYDKRTKGGNRNQQIPNRLADLIRRIRDDDNKIRSLSFGKLRKTAGDLIRRVSDGEISGVFLCHAQAVKNDGLADVYTNRPFGRVFGEKRSMSLGVSSKVNSPSATSPTFSPKKRNLALDC
ncbi:MAG: hypothetical protein CMJ48_06460 [Planctomycetaceae bacterium]|nr:hypothetical protein [Planctomycetaceae bacterium]